jgi:hypothetical protein
MTGPAGTDVARAIGDDSLRDSDLSESNGQPWLRVATGPSFGPQPS